MTENRLALAPETDKPTHRDRQRDDLIAMRLSIGLAAGHTMLCRLLRDTPFPTSAVLAEQVRLIVLAALCDMPGHIAIEDVRRVVGQGGTR